LGKGAKAVRKPAASLRGGASRASGAALSANSASIVSSSASAAKKDVAPKKLRAIEPKAPRVHVPPELPTASAKAPPPSAKPPKPSFFGRAKGLLADAWRATNHPMVLLLPLLAIGGLFYFFIVKPFMEKEEEEIATVQPPAPSEELTWFPPLSPGQDSTDLRVTSCFGPRTHPVTGEEGSHHSGIDLGTPEGTMVMAAANGTVSKVERDGESSNLGQYVKVVHSGGFETVYGHMSGITVSVGDEVAGGRDAIGLSGDTGRSTGPHLHFEIRTGGSAVDPYPYLTEIVYFKRMFAGKSCETLESETLETQ